MYGIFMEASLDDYKRKRKKKEKRKKEKRKKEITTK